LSEEDRLLSDELAELDENELTELHEPRKRVSILVTAFDSSYLGEVVSCTQPKNWLDELFGTMGYTHGYSCVVTLDREPIYGATPYPGISCGSSLG